MRLVKLIGAFNLGMIASLTLSGQAAAQDLAFTWFDTNPDRSNTDDSNPNGSSGGRIQRLGASASGNRVYGASEWGGLYQSFNQGLSWDRVNEFAPTATWDVKVDPGNSERLYVTSLYDGRVNSRAGISISTDSGNSWTNAPVSTLNCALASRQNEPSAFQIAISPTNNRTVMVGTNCGLARSFDRGATWDYVDPSAADGVAERIFAVVAHGSQIVDVIGDNGFFRSTDDGANWTAVPAAPLPSPLTSSLAPSPSETNALFRADGGNNLRVSNDGGATWSTRITLPPNNAQGRIPFVKTNQRAASNQYDVYYGDVNLFNVTFTTPTSSPGGNLAVTWNNVQTGAHADVADVIFAPGVGSDACPFLFSNDGGVYRNTQNLPGTCHISPVWEQPDRTPHATWVWSFNGLDPGGNSQRLSYGLQDNGGWATNTALTGPNDTVLFWNNYACCDVSEDAPAPGYLMSLSGFNTTDADGDGIADRPFRLRERNELGGNATEINYPTSSQFGSFISGTEVVRLESNVFAISLADGVHVTGDITANPINWTALGSPTAAAGNSGGIKQSGSGTATNLFYFTGTGNPDANPGQIFRYSGTAAGGTWNQLSPLPTNVNSVNVWDVHPNDPNHLIISGISLTANTATMWETRDFGANWTSLADLDTLMTANGTFNNQSTEGPVGFTGLATYFQPFMVQFNRQDPTTIIAGAADAGVFMSLDDAATWDLISNPTEPTSASPHIPRPLHAYFSPTRFSADTTSFDVWVATRGAGVQKVLIDGL